MAKRKKVSLSINEQDVLDQLDFELLEEPSQISRADRLICKHQYFKNATLVGEYLRYVASNKGQWLFIGYWAAASLHRKKNPKIKINNSDF